MKNGINVYVAHTNLDTAVGGVNDVLAEKLGLENAEVLAPHVRERLKKIVVFVPEDHHMKVLNAMCEAGAGWIGNYSHCTFNLRGTGTFLPGEGTNPYIGQQGKLEQVEEVRLETIVPESAQTRVVQAMLKAHPYEEVAYDIYPLELPGRSFGLGRIGRLPEKNPPESPGGKGEGRPTEFPPFAWSEIRIARYPPWRSWAGRAAATPGRPWSAVRMFSSPATSTTIRPWMPWPPDLR